MCLETIWGFLNSNFSIAFLGSISGAVAGSATILLIGWYDQQKKTLAEINASIGLLTATLNTLLNIKKQHSWPLRQEYEKNIKAYQSVQELKARGIQPESIAMNYFVNLKQFQCPKLYFELPLERIFSLYSASKEELISPLMNVKALLHEIENVCQIWNRVVVEFLELPEEESKNIYLGLNIRPGVSGNFFSDTIKNLDTVVDTGLYFTRLSIERLRKCGEMELPSWLRKKIVRAEITHEEYKRLMPPENFKSWS